MAGGGGGHEGENVTGRPQKEDQKRLRKRAFLKEKLFQTLSYMPGNRLTTGAKKIISQNVTENKSSMECARDLRPWLKINHGN